MEDDRFFKDNEKRDEREKKAERERQRKMGQEFRDRVKVMADKQREQARQYREAKEATEASSGPRLK